MSRQVQGILIINGTHFEYIAGECGCIQGDEIIDLLTIRNHQQEVPIKWQGEIPQTILNVEMISKSGKSLYKFTQGVNRSEAEDPKNWGHVRIEYEKQYGWSQCKAKLSRFFRCCYPMCYKPWFWRRTVSSTISTGLYRNPDTGKYQVVQHLRLTHHTMV